MTPWPPTTQYLFKPDSMEAIVKILVETHAQVRGVSLRDFFRSCYMRAFGKDIPSGSLDDDVRNFVSKGVTPKYVINYFLNSLGANHESHPSPNQT